MCDCIRNIKNICIEENENHLFYDCDKCKKICNIRYDNLPIFKIEYDEFDEIATADYNKRDEMEFIYYSFIYHPDKTVIKIRNIPNDIDLKNKLFSKLVPFIYMFKVFIKYEDDEIKSEKALNKLIYN